MHTELLRTAIRHSGLTTTAFAKALGVHRQTVHNWFQRGNVPEKWRTHVCRLADHKISPVDFTLSIMAEAAKEKTGVEK